MPDFPSWWMPNKKQARVLADKRIFDTVALIDAANASSNERGRRACSVEHLYRYCNEHLCGLKLKLKYAYTEDRIEVHGRRPDTVISYGATPQEDRLSDRPPNCSSPPALYRAPPLDCPSSPRLSDPYPDPFPDRLPDRSSPPALYRAPPLDGPPSPPRCLEDRFVTPHDDVYGWTEEDLHLLPEELYCPITTDAFVDPVVASDGFTYERTQIEQWLQKNDTSPLTGEPLEHRHLYPNRIALQYLRRIA